MIGGQVPLEHSDHLVITISAGYVPAFASDQLHLVPPLWPYTQRNATMLA